MCEKQKRGKGNLWFSEPKSYRRKSWVFITFEIYAESRHQSLTSRYCRLAFWFVSSLDTVIFSEFMFTQKEDAKKIFNKNLRCSHFQEVKLFKKR